MWPNPVDRFHQFSSIPTGPYINFEGMSTVVKDISAVGYFEV